MLPQMQILMVQNRHQTRDWTLIRSGASVKLKQRSSKAYYNYYNCLKYIFSGANLGSRHDLNCPYRGCPKPLIKWIKVN